MGVGYNPSIVTNSLLAYWDAGNTKSYSGSGTSWFDLSGNSNTGTLVDGPTFSSNSLVFDGTSNRIHAPASLKWSADGSIGYGQMTISLWIKTTDTGGLFFSKPWNGSGQYNIGISADTFSLVSGTSTTTYNAIGLGTTLYSGVWKNLVCWMDGVNMGYYINGINQSSKAHSLTGAAPSSGDLSISLCLMSLYPYNSGWAGNSGFSINGNMAICKVYNRVLSSTEREVFFQRKRYNLLL